MTKVRKIVRCSPLSFLKIPKNDNILYTLSTKFHKNGGFDLLIDVWKITLTTTLSSNPRFLWQIIVYV